MNSSDVTKWEYVVNSVALEYHKKFDMVEIADLRQALWVWFAEHPNKVTEWEAIGERDAKNLIYKSLRNQAIDYCQKWKAKTIGYDTGDLYYYAPEVVEAILPAVLRQEYGVQHKLNLGRIGRPTAPSEGGNMMVLMLEIDYAYWKLSKEDRKIIFMKHAQTLDFKEIANLLSLGSEDSARMRHRRAINRLIRRLGGHKPYIDHDLEDSQEQEDGAVDNEIDSQEE
jgi:DNA-directed RNA polymerase specialized sigma24 family protein